MATVGKAAMSHQNPETTEQAPPRESKLYLAFHYRRSPFFDATQRYGCEAYDIYNHMFLPSSYGRSDIDEYWHLLEHVTLWDVGVERVVEISGPDAEAFTDQLTCRDLQECAVGQGKYAPLIDEEGGIVNDPVLLRVEADRFWLCLADSDAGLWARGIKTGTDYDVEIDEPDVHPVQIQGPKSQPLMEDLLGPEISELEYYWCGEAEVDGEIPVVVSRTGWTGEVGYEVYLRDSQYGDQLWERIMEVGEPYNIRPTPPSTIRRVEAGIFNWGSDMDLENNPFQISGMERLVEFTGRDYIGRAALERIEATGVDRKLVGVEIEGEIETWNTVAWPASHDGREVGHATATTWSPRLEQGLGYVWVPIELADPGHSLELEEPTGETHAATTTTLPFYDPEKAVPKGETS